MTAQSPDRSVKALRAEVERLKGEHDRLVRSLGEAHRCWNLDIAEVEHLKGERDAAREERDRAGRLWKFVTDERDAARAELAQADRDLEAIHTRDAALLAKADALADAATTLRAKMVEADHFVTSVFAIAQMHVGPYEGPRYVHELADFDAALARYRGSP